MISSMRRESMLKNVANTPHWDVVVIGGGASGLWCAYDAALRGFKTILIEKGDFASGTSSKSTKLIHGGVRYLKQGHISLVREALLERRHLATIAPHLVTTRSFIIPYYKPYERLYYGFGMGIYDFFSGPMGQEPYKSLSTAEVLNKCPTLGRDKLRGGCLFTDGQFDDSRFAIELAKMAAMHDATVLNYVEATSFLKQGSRVVGVDAKDAITGEQVEIFGKVVINATGIFTDEVKRMDNPKAKPIMALSRGSHIVLDKKFLPGKTAIVIPKTKDGRIAFMIPWIDRVLLGTTDVQTDKPVDNPRATKEEIDFLLDAAGDYFTSKPTYDNILSAFAGIRPLVKTSSGSTAKLMRSHKVERSKSGLITLTGGKWTTARKMAQDTLDFVTGLGLLEKIPCNTAVMPFDETTHLHKGEKLHSNLPYTNDDIEIAIEHEMATNLTDVLARRTRALILDAKASLEVAPQVAQTLQKRLGHSDAWREEQIDKYKTEVRLYLP